MLSAADSTASLLLPVPGVPAWAVPRAPVEDDLEAAWMAGGALNSLDNLVRTSPEWDGAWRHRLALAAAAATVRLAGRREDAAALRDAWYLRRAGDDAGPAGNVLAAWRRFCARSSVPDPESLRTVAGWLGVGWTDALAGTGEIVEEAAASAAPAPLAAARVAKAVAERAPRAEPLAWWAADLALSRRMRWPLPVPVLSTQIHSPFLRLGVDRIRARPGGEGFERAACIAAAAGAAEACRLGAAIAARARRLREVAPGLRSKGAGEVVGLLLGDDAVPASLTTAALSRWASRRLFERLTRLGAVRELSGRASFRLYGL